VTGYGYLLDLIDSPAASSSTLGLHFAGGTDVSETVKALYTVEFAIQSDYKQGAATIDADYSLIEVAAKASGITAKLGVETLSDDGSYCFSTPLATAHAFNCWADKFLAMPANGLVDTFVSVADKVSGAKTRKIGNYTVLAKYASYSADSFATDTDKLWLMGQAKF